MESIRTQNEKIQEAVNKLMKMTKKKKREEAYSIIADIIYKSQKVGSATAIEAYNDRIKELVEQGRQKKEQEAD